MTIGAGKYDDLCTYVREAAGLDPAIGGAAVVIIVGGKRGSGFSVQADLATGLTLPDLLEEVARRMRDDTAARGNA